MNESYRNLGDEASEGIRHILNEAKPMGRRVVECVDGPSAGYIHEVRDGWPCPDEFGCPDGDAFHWYRVEGSKAYFDHTEPRKGGAT